MRYYSNLPAYERPYTVDMTMAQGYYPSVNINTQGSPNIAPGPAIYQADKYVTGQPQTLGITPGQNASANIGVVLLLGLVGYGVFKLLP